MPDEDRDFWATGRRRAQRRRETRAPRTQAIKDAMAVVQPMKGQSSDVIRVALLREMSARGITDATDEEVHFLVTTVNSPRRAAAGLLLRQLKAIGKTVSLFHALASEAQPRWTLTPDDVPSLVSWRPDQQEVEIVLNARDFPTGRDTLRRLFDDLPHVEPDEIGPNEARPFGCWLSDEQGYAGPAPVKIYVGKFLIGELPAAHVDLARLLIARHGKDKHAIDIVAEAVGHDADSGELHLFLPDKP